MAATIIIPLAVAVYQSFSDDEPPDGVLGFERGCEPFVLSSQNRWAALGASAQAEPAPTGEKVGSFAPNELITTDGWARRSLAV